MTGWYIMLYGVPCPVTHMFDVDGNETTEPVLAISVVCGTPYGTFGTAVLHSEEQLKRKDEMQWH